LLYRNFRKLLIEANIPKRLNGRYPRIHDLRHTFCVRTLENIINTGADLYTSISHLSTYLGHHSITDTEYYLRLVDEQFTDITSKSEAYSPDLFPKL
jgi:integrase